MHPSRRPRRLRAALAAAAVLVVGPLPASQATAEEAAAPELVVGEVVRAWAEPRSPEEATALHAEPLTWVEPVRGEAVRLPSDQVEELPVGSTVAVRIGDQVLDAAAAEGGIDPAREVLTAEVVAPAEEAPVARAAPPYTNEVTVALVAPPGTTPTSTTAAQVEAVVAGAVADFWKRESYRAITIGVAATDADNEWYRSTARCSDPSALWGEVAEHVGFVGGPGKHLLLYLPPTPDLEGCGYGLGTVGSAPTSGGAAYVRSLLPSIVAHELGHNFGLGHSSLEQCDRAIERPPCENFPYLDLYDVMGYSWDRLGSLSALHGHQLGVLPEAGVHRVEQHDATADYVLAPIGSRTGRVGIRLAWDDLVYWLEYRTATGQDAWLAGDSDLRTGVLLRSESAEGEDSSRLLDGTPSAQGNWTSDLQTVLPAGRSLRLQHGGFHVTVKSATASQAVVRISTLAGAPFPRDLDGDHVADLMAVDASGVLYRYPASGTGGFGARRVAGRGWQSRDLITTVGDWTGDDVHDVIARDSRNGDLWLYRGNDRGGFSSWQVIGRGWGIFSALVAPGDWNGDGSADLLARKRSDGTLWLYAGNGTGGFTSRRQVGKGWNAMTGFAATGDWDANGTIDVIARRRDGALLLYSGTGSGGFSGAPRVIGRGWQVFTALTGPGDWNGDAVSDLLARRTDGSLWLYTGDGFGLFGATAQVGSGWSRYRLAS